MAPFWTAVTRGVADERFILHRYKSTSHASVVAALIMGGWALYDLYGKGVMRWDFMIVLGVMAVVKLSFMLWYRVRD